MSSQRRSDSSYLVQGSILAIASIVSRVIGLVYRMPLTAIIGNHGNDYYSTAFEIYSMLLLISSYSLPMAVSKMVSARVASRQNENAYRVFKSAALFAFITGLIGCLILLFGSGLFTKLFKTPLAIYALRVLAPTLIIVAVLGVVRGFFQGLGTMIPSAFSQIIEQVINAVVSVGSAYVLFQYGMRIGTAVSGVSTQDFASAYGAAGGTLGTGIGAAFALLFVGFTFFAYRPSFKKRFHIDSHHRAQVENYKSVMRILVLTIVPILLSTTVYNLVSIVDQIIFKNIAAVQGYEKSIVSTWWGIYAGKYRVLVNVPISIASALAVSAVPVITSAFAQGDRETVRRKIGMSLRFEMVIAFPMTVGLMVLASPIQQLLFGDGTRLTANLMIFGAISIIFYSISTLSNAMLQAIDQMRTPVINAVIALVVQGIAILICMFVLHLGIYSVIIANIVFSLVMCILNGRAVAEHSGFRVRIRKTYIKPAMASIVMGIITWLFYHGIHKVTHSNAIACVIAIIIAMIVYAVVMLKIKGITEKELYSFPKGTAIIRIAKKVHLL